VGETVKPVLEGFSVRRLRRARVGRRAFLGVLAVFLALGFANVFGVRTTTASATGGGYTLRVTYPSVSRPGLATPWSVEIRRPGGFREPVTLATTFSYFDIFDRNTLDPEPSSSTTAGDRIVWELDPPLGDTLTVTLDGQIEPDWSGGRKAVTAILEGGEEVVSVSYRTRILP
jgi:hypothetical protein